MTDKKLISMAAEAMENSYSPYSRVKVGAAVECADGSVFTGCNIENAVVASSICAEASAVASAVSAGCRGFRRIAIISEGNTYRFPCGACRQMLYEFSPNMEILSVRADGRYVSYKLEKLLPMAFGKEQIIPLQTEQEETPHAQNMQEAQEVKEVNEVANGEQGLELGVRS